MEEPESSETLAVRFLAVLWAEWRPWGQTTPASNDLRGGVCGTALSVASCKRPRQNSQDRSLIQPGSAFSMTSTKRCGPSTVSRRRTSSNEARLIACARTLASDRGCEPIGSHQKNFCFRSDRKSFRSRYVVDPSMVFYIASDAACGHFGTFVAGIKLRASAGNPGAVSPRHKRVYARLRRAMADPGFRCAQPGLRLRRSGLRGASQPVDSPRNIFFPLTA
jgi:hypothetical protein